MNTKLTTKKLREKFLSELRKEDPIFLGILRDRRLLDKYLQELITIYSIRETDYSKVKEYVKSLYDILITSKTESLKIEECYIEKYRILNIACEQVLKTQSIFYIAIEKLKQENKELYDILIKYNILLKYIVNAIAHRNNKLLANITDLKVAFNWLESKEGYKFWNNLFNKFKSHV